MHSCASLMKWQCCVTAFITCTFITLLPPSPSSQLALLQIITSPPSFNLIFLRERCMVDCCEGYGGNGGDLSWEHKGKGGAAEQGIYGTMTECCKWRLFITVLGDMNRDGRKQMVNVALEDGQIYGLGQQTLYNSLWHGSGQLWEGRVKEQRIISTYKAIKMLFVTMSVYVCAFEPVRLNCILNRRYSNMFCTNSCFPLNIPIL